MAHVDPLEDPANHEHYASLWADSEAMERQWYGD